MHQTIISFQLTQEEKALIERVYYLEPWLQDAVDNRRRKDNKFQIKLDNYEVKDCVDALLFHAEYERADKKQFMFLVQKIYKYWQLKNMISQKRPRVSLEA